MTEKAGQLPPDQAAREAACDPSRSVLVRAPAGSGKTGVLLLRYLRCLLTVSEPEHVVAITFTKKAAAEIRERVLQALQWARQDQETTDDYQRRIVQVAAEVLRHDQAQGWTLLENPARLRVATFDSFCNSLARRLPLLSGLGQIQTSDDSDTLYREAILSLFRALDKRETSPELRRALGNVLDYASNRLEQLLPLLANLLAKRDQWVSGVVGADLDVMEEALQKHLRERLRLLCDRLSTGGLQTTLDALVQLSAESEPLAWAAELRPLTDGGEGQQVLLTRVADTLLTAKGDWIAPRTASAARGFIKGHPATDQIKAWLEAQRDTPEGEQLAAQLQALRKLPAPQLPDQARNLIADLMQVLVYLLAEMRLVFEREGQVDFAEVAFRAIQALAPLDEDVLDDDAVYSDVLLQEDRIQHVLVDEMQDTSVSQMELLKHLMQGWQPGDGRSLFLCGDLQQSIYLFRGALVGLFGELIEAGHFHGHNLEQLQLQANFRSAPAVVNWVNHSFARILADNFVEALPMRDLQGAVQVHGFIGNDRQAAAEAEARRVVELIRGAQEDNPEASIAVLVRSRSHLQQIIPQLKKAGIAFAGQDIDKLQTEPAVADFLALLRAWWHDADRAAWVGLLRAPFVGLGWDDIWVLCHQGEQQGLLSERVLDGRADGQLSAEGAVRLQRLRRHWQAIAGQGRSVDIRWAVPALWYSLGGPACMAPHQQTDIDRVLALIHECAPGGYLQDIAAFERALDRLYAQPPQASVELMTIHRAKGLEYDVVIVPGLGSPTRGGDSHLFYWRRMGGALVLAPRPQTDTEDGGETRKLYDYLREQHTDDERREVDRLLYVALTRARRQLHLIGTAQENSRGELKPTAHSLLDKLWPVLRSAFSEAENLPAAEQHNLRRPPLAPRLETEPSLMIRACHQQPAREETVLDRLAEQEKQAVLEDNIEDRAVGIVYHELMRRLGSGHRQILADRPALEQAVDTRLRHYCHPEPGLNDSRQRVLRLLDNTLSCPHGQWILDHYQQHGAEQAVRRKLGDNWQKLIIDRFFIDGDRCWIVDYKTAEGSGEAFFAAQRERYRDKMERYREAIAETGMAEAISVALYFPAQRHLESW